MTTTDILHMLFGAALVAIGVLATALADRIRGLRVSREREAVPRERSSREQGVPAAAAIPVVEPAEILRAHAPPAKPQRRVEPKPAASTEGGEDVIAALVASGYKKVIAAEATWACSAAERATVEGWTAASLRRCARGGMS